MSGASHPGGGQNIMLVALTGWGQESDQGAQEADLTPI
jgi:hypothetical protein